MSRIEKIKKLQKGIYNRNIQVGYEGKTTNQRKEGEESGQMPVVVVGRCRMVRENRLLKYHQEDLTSVMIVKSSY